MSATTALMGVSALSSIGTAFAQSGAQKAASIYQESVYRSNERMAEVQAADAISRGEKEAKKTLQNTRVLVGAQRAAMAAQGLDLESGSALDIQQETAGIGAMDALDIKNNAWREAWGYKVQANQYGQQAAFTKITGKNQSRTTLLTGGLSAAKDIATGYYSTQEKNELAKYFSTYGKTT